MLGIYFIFGTKFSWNERIDTCFNVECVLLGRNFFGGYLVVTARYLVATARYLVVTGAKTYLYGLKTSENIKIEHVFQSKAFFHLQQKLLQRL